ncbi:MAG: tagaturonate epimerase family protein [Spirochaetota bacterium]
MERLVKLLLEENLIRARQEYLETVKLHGRGDFRDVGVTVYTSSLYKKNDILHLIASIDNRKNFFLLAEREFKCDFQGEAFTISGVQVIRADFSWENYLVLKDQFPFVAPVSLRDKKTTIGCGDRLGLATPGHIRAVKKFDVYPVLAQQSIRELTLTGRNYQGVVADAAFLVFQEGYEKGYGADGDHLKRIEDIDVALDAGMPMITLDLTEVMNPAVSSLSRERIEVEFENLSEAVKEKVLRAYSGRQFTVGNSSISFTEPEAKKCALMYWKALDFSARVDEHLKKRRGSQYDLEISIDETTSPTLPSHHLFIAAELKSRGVTVNSLAPRFVGEFQKGIDYIGSVEEFERQFKEHCDIAKAYGNYKISIHSGSDKFSVYPVIGKYTQGRLHLKTAGTSWLEAVRTIAKNRPGLYREMHKKALANFPEAKKLYHITADITKIQDVDSIADRELPEYLNIADSRQLLHITYGMLKDPEIRFDFFRSLAEVEEAHYSSVAENIEKHIRLLGL